MILELYTGQRMLPLSAHGIVLGPFDGCQNGATNGPLLGLATTMFLDVILA
jgi:hypothetical protein